MDGSCHQDDELLKEQVMISLQSEDLEEKLLWRQPLCPQLGLRQADFLPPGPQQVGLGEHLSCGHDMVYMKAYL